MRSAPGTPIWSRKPEDGGGMITGSVGAFLVLESREHAEARGARIYATIDAIGGDRGSRDEDRLEQRLDALSKPCRRIRRDGDLFRHERLSRSRRARKDLSRSAVPGCCRCVPMAASSATPSNPSFRSASRFAALTLGAGPRCRHSIRPRKGHERPGKDGHRHDHRPCARRRCRRSFGRRIRSGA